MAAVQEPGVSSARSHVAPDSSCPLVLQMMFDALLKPAVEEVPTAVMFADEILMICWSFWFGVVVVEFPRPVNEPPNMMFPFELFTIELTGPLTPSNGRFAHPDIPTQASAFVEFAPLNSPPTYTVLVASSHRSALTEPVRPGRGVIDPDVESYIATPCVSEPPKLVKLPPTITPANLPFCITKGHIALMYPSAEAVVEKSPLGSCVMSDWVPLVLNAFSVCCW